MKRGDVVLVQFPHAGATPPKLRPALVVQADFYNQRISNVLVATITSNLRRRGDRAHYFIDVSSALGKLTGLNQNSLVSCLNLAVVPTGDVRARIGELSPQTMQGIDECLKAAFGIP